MLGEGPITQIVFTEEEIVDYRSVYRADRIKAREFSLSLFKKGIFLNPLGTKLYISLAHSSEDIEHLIEVVDETLSDIFE